MSTPVISAPKRPIYLFTARNNITPPAKHSADYEFYAKFGREPPDLACNFSVVSIRRLPRMFQGLDLLLGKIDEGFLGYIHYTFCGSTAISDRYYPKDNAPGISTLGFFLELIATHDLLKGLAEKIRTTQTPKHCRASRLKYAHLPVGKETDGKAWELGLSSAIRRRAEKLRRLASLEKAA